MKIAWAILLITALTDFLITGGTAIMTVMSETKNGLPGMSAWIAAGIGGLIVAARTVQQALKATPATTADLKGVPVTVVTTTPTATVMTGTTTP